MEGHRYADEESSWYPGQGQYTRSTDPDISGSHQVGGSPYDSSIDRPSGAFRLPEQRPATNPYALTDPLSPVDSGSVYDTQARIPVRGPEYPAVPAPALSTPPAEAEPAVPPPAPGRSTSERSARSGDSVYQTRRPVTSVLVAVVMGVLMIPVVRLLLVETFSGDPSARGIVPAVLLTLGFTLTGIGLYAVARGGPVSRESWLRPPVTYLPAGLILLLAAGLAVA